MLPLLLCFCQPYLGGAAQSGNSFADRAVVARAAALEEAWAWGFDVDAWRAHLNVLSWPEVLRETAIALSLGPKRPRDRRAPRPKQARPPAPSGSIKPRLGGPSARATAARRASSRRAPLRPLSG